MGGVHQLPEHPEPGAVARLFGNLLPADGLCVVLHLPDGKPERQQRAAHDLDAGFELGQDDSLAPSADRSLAPSRVAARAITWRAGAISCAAATMICVRRLIGYGDDQGAGPAQAGMLENLGIRGIAEQRVDAGRAAG